MGVCTRVSAPWRREAVLDVGCTPCTPAGIHVAMLFSAQLCLWASMRVQHQASGQRVLCGHLHHLLGLPRPGVLGAAAVSLRA